jgi:hypothetical protein
MSCPSQPAIASFSSRTPVDDGRVVSAQEYRENAQECLGWARTARTEREREIFLQMARTWFEAGRTPALTSASARIRGVGGYARRSNAGARSRGVLVAGRPMPRRAAHLASGPAYARRPSLVCAGLGRRTTRRRSLGTNQLLSEIRYAVVFATTPVSHATFSYNLLRPWRPSK